MQGMQFLGFIRPNCFGQNGWGGRTRTFNLLVNSQASCRLDHTPSMNLAFLLWVLGIQQIPHRPALVRALEKISSEGNDGGFLRALVAMCFSR
jgi:hypothetical protein